MNVILYVTCFSFRNVAVVVCTFSLLLNAIEPHASIITKKKKLYKKRKQKH